MPRSKSTITYKKKDSIAIVSMNRPEFNNAQNGKMTYDLDKAFKKAINNSNKVAMSLSDLFCVERHKDQFLSLVKNKLDITFANEQEIMSLISQTPHKDLFVSIN